MDIGYAAVFLSRFSTALTKEHYLALNGVCKYLCCTKDWGCVYWHITPVTSLSAVPLEQLPYGINFSEMPPSELVGFVHAVHATDIEKQQSIKKKQPSL